MANPGRLGGSVSLAAMEEALGPRWRPLVAALGAVLPSFPTVVLALVADFALIEPLNFALPATKSLARAVERGGVVGGQVAWAVEPDGLTVCRTAFASRPWNRNRAPRLVLEPGRHIAYFSFHCDAACVVADTSGRHHLVRARGPGAATGLECVAMRCREGRGAQFVGHHNSVCSLRSLKWQSGTAGRATIRAWEMIGGVTPVPGDTVSVAPDRETWFDFVVPHATPGHCAVLLSPTSLVLLWIPSGPERLGLRGLYVTAGDDGLQKREPWAAVDVPCSEQICVFAASPERVLLVSSPNLALHLVEAKTGRVVCSREVRGCFPRDVDDLHLTVDQAHGVASAPGAGGGRSCGSPCSHSACCPARPEQRLVFPRFLCTVNHLIVGAGQFFVRRRRLTGQEK